MPKTYTTISGDMWDLISKKTLGSEMYADTLIAHNRKYRHLYIFPAGIVLEIPEIRATPSPLLPPWKRGGAI